jgi:hypothetical protein
MNKTLIHNHKELENFLKLIPNTKNDELYLISLSARSKYLIDDERKKYQFSHDEMFGREFLYNLNIDTVEYILTKMYHTLQYRKTKTGEFYPPHATIVYFNLNPTSAINAYLSFQEKMNQEVKLYINSLNKNNQINMHYERFKRGMDIYKSELQKNITRNFIDIDFDTKDFSYVERFIQYLKSKSCFYFVIETKSGFHVSIRKDSIGKGNKFYMEIGKLHTELKRKDPTKEIVLNKNGMIPLPGTLQGGFEVKIIKGV